MSYFINIKYLYDLGCKSTAFITKPMLFTSGMKVLLDFVPNHSSDEHEWFNKSLSGDPKYDDYYVWKNASGFDRETGEPLPPNNWGSFFGGPAWTWRPEREQFYLHQFTPGQPDLNYREENNGLYVVGSNCSCSCLNFLPGYLCSCLTRFINCFPLPCAGTPTSRGRCWMYSPFGWSRAVTASEWTL